MLSSSTVWSISLRGECVSSSRTHFYLWLLIGTQHAQLLCRAKCITGNAIIYRKNIVFRLKSWNVVWSLVTGSRRKEGWSRFESSCVRVQMGGGRGKLKIKNHSEWSKQFRRMEVVVISWTWVKSTQFLVPRCTSRRKQLPSLNSGSHQCIITSTTIKKLIFSVQKLRPKCQHNCMIVMMFRSHSVYILLSLHKSNKDLANVLWRQTWLRKTCQYSLGKSLCSLIYVVPYCCYT